MTLLFLNYGFKIYDYKNIFHLFSPLCSKFSFKIKNYFIILHIRVLCLRVCLFITCVFDILEDQKCVSCNMTLKLQMVMGCHMSGGN